MEIKKTTKKDIDVLMDMRLEMLRIVNGMEPDDCFDEVLVDSSWEYFLNGNQTTVLQWKVKKLLDVHQSAI